MALWTPTVQVPNKAALIRGWQFLFGKIMPGEIMLDYLISSRFIRASVGAVKLGIMAWGVIKFGLLLFMLQNYGTITNGGCLLNSFQGTNSLILWHLSPSIFILSGSAKGFEHFILKYDMQNKELPDFKWGTKVYSSIAYTIPLRCIAAWNSWGLSSDLWQLKLLPDCVVLLKTRDNINNDDKWIKGRVSNKILATLRVALLSLHCTLLSFTCVVAEMHFYKKKQKQMHEQNRHFSLLKTFHLYGAFRFTTQTLISRVNKWRDKHAVP